MDVQQVVLVFAITRLALDACVIIYMYVSR